MTQGSPASEEKRVAKNGADKPLTVDEELALLDQEEAAAEAKVADAEKRKQLDVKRLRKKLRDELGGVEGVDWCIVETSADPIALKLGTAPQYKRYLSAKREKNDLPSLETMHAFVQPNVVSDKARFEEIIDKHQAALVICVGRLVALYEGNRAGALGK